jgi:hypothetical protein
MKNMDSATTRRDGRNSHYSSNLWTLHEAARFLRVKYARAAELARTNQIPGVVHLGRQIRIDPSPLLSFVAEGGKPLAGGWKKEAHNG